MADIESVKARLAESVRLMEGAIDHSTPVLDKLDEAGGQLSGVTKGSGHDQAGEALSMLQGARDRLEEAMTLARGAIDEATAYSQAL
ncbi:hypothetical protein AB0I28_22535 [Phytomonospora sp. NPDC050363]|uniref:hypothetical protein n=1 Tax=Phytomonospora sp. NPDC050363 TaxID=3155642 RepID=UPI0033D871DB